MKKLISIYFTWTSKIFPKLAASQAFRLFQVPINKKIRSKELPFFEQAKSFKVSWYLEDIQCYETGPENGSIVLLVHGWESNAASFSQINAELAQSGHRVISFNLPAHGYSKLKSTNLKYCKEAFLQVVNYLNPQDKISIITHSFGSAVTSYSLSKSNFKIKNLIFLTTPDSLSDVFKEFSDFVGLSTKAFQALLNMAENLLHDSMDNMFVSKLGGAIDYENFYIIHDEGDKIISKDKAVKVAESWKNSRLEFIQGTGHYKMLWSQTVVEKVSSYLALDQTVDQTPNVSTSTTPS